MSRDATKGAVCYDVEVNWGEDVDVTADWRLPMLESLDVSGLTWTKLDPQRVTQRRNEITRWIPGPKGGSFRTKMYMTGRGSTSGGAGPLALSKLSTLLGYVIGNATIARTTGMTAGGDWDLNDGTVSLSGGTLPGSILWFGTKGDGFADGQPSVVATHTLLQLDLLVDLPGIPPSASPIYAADMIYPSETPSAAQQDLTGLRFLLQTANLQYQCHGCFARSFTVTGTNPNELLTIEIEWGVSWWEETSVTFPNATSTDEFTPLPNAAGSFFLAPVGTTTRAGNTRNYRSLTIGFQLGIAEQVGPGGVNAYQSLVGAKRTPDVVTVEWEEDADGPTTTPALATLFDADASYHGLIAFTILDGQRVAFRFPAAEFYGERPNQSNGDGINRVTGRLRLGAGDTLTSELTQSAYRWGLG